MCSTRLTNESALSDDDEIESLRSLKLHDLRLTGDLEKPRDNIGHKGKSRPSADDRWDELQLPPPPGPLSASLLL